MGQGKKNPKCFETLAQSSFANTFPLGLVGELLETKTKIRPKMLQKWDFSCSPFFFKEDPKLSLENYLIL